MRKVLVIAAVLCAFCATQATSQIVIPNIVIPTVTMTSPPASYDPFPILPGAKGSIGADVGLDNSKISKIGKMSDVFVMGKYVPMEKLEVGARVDFGFLMGSDADAFQTAIIGAKYGLTPKSAAIANFLIPAGVADDPGLTVGYIQSLETNGIMIDGQATIGILKGYAPKIAGKSIGLPIDVRLEPCKSINDKLSAYLDIDLGARTKNFGDNLNIDLRPFVNYTVQEGLVANAGVSINAYNGVERNSDIGIFVTAIKTMSK